MLDRRQCYLSFSTKINVSAWLFIAHMRRRGTFPAGEEEYGNTKATANYTNQRWLIATGITTGNPGSVIVPQYSASNITVFVWGKNTIVKPVGNTHRALVTSGNTRSGSYLLQASSWRNSFSSEQSINLCSLYTSPKAFRFYSCRFLPNDLHH